MLGDIVGPAADGCVAAPGAAIGDRRRRARPPCHRFGDGIVVLDRVPHGADRARGDARRDAIAALRGAPDGVTWIDADAGRRRDALDAGPRPARSRAARAVIDAARAGDARDRARRARRASAAVRPPPRPARRRDVDGAGSRRWLAEAVDGFGAERPLVPRPPAAGDRERLRPAALQRRHRRRRRRPATAASRAAFERRGEIVEFRPTRLGAVETVYAMTVHKSQGSQFDTAAVLLPAADVADPHPRAALHRGHPRAEQLILVGTEEAVRAAVDRPVARASGLRWRLWGEG